MVLKTFHNQKFSETLELRDIAYDVRAKASMFHSVKVYTLNAPFCVHFYLLFRVVSQDYLFFGFLQKFKKNLVFFQFLVDFLKKFGTFAKGRKIPKLRRK